MPDCCSGQCHGGAVHVLEEVRKWQIWSKPLSGCAFECIRIASRQESKIKIILSTEKNTSSKSATEVVVSSNVAYGQVKLEPLGGKGGVYEDPEEMVNPTRPDDSDKATPK